MDLPPLQPLFRPYLRAFKTEKQSMHYLGVLLLPSAFFTQ